MSCDNNGGAGLDVANGIGQSGLGFGHGESFRRHGVPPEEKIVIMTLIGATAMIKTRAASGKRYLKYTLDWYLEGTAHKVTSRKCW
jgi:hypothetical protein